MTIETLSPEDQELLALQKKAAIELREEFEVACPDWRNTPNGPQIMEYLEQKINAVEPVRLRQ